MQNLGFLLGVAANAIQLAGFALYYGEPNVNRRWMQFAGIGLILAPIGFAALPLEMDFYFGCLTIPGLIGNLMFLFGIGISGAKAPLGGALMDAVGTFLLAASPTLLIAAASFFK